MELQSETENNKLVNSEITKNKTLKPKKVKLD